MLLFNYLTCCWLLWCCYNMLLFNNQLLKLLIKTLFGCLSSCFSNYLWCEAGSGLRERRQIHSCMRTQTGSLTCVKFLHVLSLPLSGVQTQHSFDSGIKSPWGFSRKCPQQSCWTGEKCLKHFQENMMNQSECSWSSERICVLQVSVGEPDQTRDQRHFQFSAVRSEPGFVMWAKHNRKVDFSVKEHLMVIGFIRLGACFCESAARELFLEVPEKYRLEAVTEQEDPQSNTLHYMLVLQKKPNKKLHGSLQSWRNRTLKKRWWRSWMTSQTVAELFWKTMTTCWM